MADQTDEGLAWQVGVWDQMARIYRQELDTSHERRRSSSTTPSICLALWISANQIDASAKLLGV